MKTNLDRINAEEEQQPRPELRSAAILLDVFARLVAALHAQDGLSHLQWVILRRLADPDGAYSTVSDLAAFIALSTPPTSRAVKILCEKHLLDIVPDDADQRRKRLKVTEKGVALLEKDPLNQISAALEGMDDATRSALIAGIGVIATDLTHSDNPSSARVLLNRAGLTGPGRTRSAP